MRGGFSSLIVERAVLGCILEDPTVLPHGADLLPEDFSFSSNACVFTHLMALSKAGEPMDLVTLVARLENCAELEGVGGAEYVAGLVDGAVRPNFSAYVKTLKRYARRRELIDAGRRFVARAEDTAIADNEVLTEFNHLSATLRDGLAAERELRFRTAAELAAGTPKEVQWVVRPFVAAGGITLAIGKVKAAGKTTLFTYLVKSILDGAPFLGMGTTKGPVLYLSEQSDATLNVVLQRAGLSHRDDLRVLTWAEASWLSWPELVRLALKKCKEIGAVILVVDTIGQFTGLAGDTENNAGDALRAIQSLQQAAAEGLGILVGQHERKSGGEIEDSGRGSSAFAGAADIVLNIRRLPGHSRPTLRVIRALSRFDETPSELTVELAAEGYVMRDSCRIASEQAEISILAVAPESEPGAVTMDYLCAAASVKRTSGQDAVKNLLAEGRLSQIGKGRRGDPRRYYASETHSAGTALSRAAETNGCGAEHVGLVDTAR